jgi:integrase
MPELTVAAVEKYVADKTRRREIRDTLAKGLYLIIQPKPRGSKSWALRFRRPDGKPAKLTLGPVDLSNEPKDEPILGGSLTLRQARELAAQIDRRRARGEDVIAEEKTKAARDADNAIAAAANTFGAAAREFFGDHRTKKWNTLPRRWHEAARIIGFNWPLGTDDPAKVEPTIIPGSLAATWATKPVAEIDGHDIHRVVDDARKNGIPGMTRHNKGVSAARGRKMHSALSVLFRWLLRNRKIPSNPTTDVSRPDAGAERDRVLTGGEIIKFWNATDTIAAPYGSIFKMLLLTGCRLNEVAGMRYDELADGTWSLPGTRTKNHRPLVLVLPPLALDLIPPTEGVYVFGSDKPVTSFSRMKAELDKAMPGVPPWVTHDLRRTAATGMANLGIMPHVIEAVLNHVSGAKSGVAGIYNRAAYTDEKRAALERWATHIDGLVSGRGAKVTDIKAGRRR